MDAIIRIGEETPERCTFISAIITNSVSVKDEGAATIETKAQQRTSDRAANSTLNDSQIAALEATGSPVTLIWGPPGIVLQFPEAPM